MIPEYEQLLPSTMSTGSNHCSPQWWIHHNNKKHGHCTWEQTPVTQHIPWKVYTKDPPPRLPRSLWYEMSIKWILFDTETLPEWQVKHINLRPNDNDYIQDAQIYISPNYSKLPEGWSSARVFEQLCNTLLCLSLGESSASLLHQGEALTMQSHTMYFPNYITGLHMVSVSCWKNLEASMVTY